MADYVIPPPTEKIIPVTRNCDRPFSVERVDANGNQTNFAQGTTVYMWVEIRGGDPVRVDATINGAIAAFLLESTLCDQIKNNGRFQVVLDLGDRELPLLVGKFARHDG